MDYSTPTLPTVASRIPSLKSRGIVRGNVIHNNRVHVYESGLEQNVLRYFCARPDVAEVVDQPPPVYYVGADGKRHQGQSRLAGASGPTGDGRRQAGSQNQPGGCDQSH